MKYNHQIANNHKNKLKHGFTMIELLFAVANFAFILMIAVSAFIAVMQVYNKANSARQTQQASRAIADLFTRDTQFAERFLGLASVLVSNREVAGVNIAGDRFCMISNENNSLIAYYVDSGPDASPVKDLWRTEIVSGDIEALIGSATCETVVEHILKAKEPTPTGIFASHTDDWLDSNLTPGNVDVDHFVALNDKLPTSDYSVLMLGLTKGGAATSTNDPFRDVFNIQLVASRRTEIISP